MKNVILIIVLMNLMIFDLHAQKNQIVSDSILTDLYRHATGKFKRGDTLCQVRYHYYVVVEVTNRNTNETKEICTQYRFLEDAMRIDANAIIDEDSRVFKFQNNQALHNVGFYKFHEHDIVYCIHNIPVNQLLKEWNLNKIDFTNDYSGSCEKYFAYKLFKAGILTGSGGIAGGLYIRSEEEILKEKNEMK